LSTVNDIMFSPVNAKSPQRWGLVIGRYNRRIVWFEKGERLAHYDPDLTTVAFFGDLPVTMNRQNCEDFRFSHNQIVFQPERNV
jgi:hypothetical protein